MLTMTPCMTVIEGLGPIHNCDPVSISSVVTFMLQLYMVMLRRLITDDVDEKLRKDLDRIGMV